MEMTERGHLGIAIHASDRDDNEAWPRLQHRCIPSARDCRRQRHRAGSGNRADGIPESPSLPPLKSHRAGATFPPYTSLDNSGPHPPHRGIGHLIDLAEGMDRMLACRNV